MFFKRTPLLILVVAIAISAAACSLIVGSLHECDTSADCKKGLLCQQNACVGEELPTGCRFTEDAGIPLMYGPEGDNVINIGVILPLTDTAGNANSRYYYNWRAIRLAVDEINERGVGGRKFALITCDTQSNNKGNVQAQVNWMATKHVPATIIFTSSATGEGIAAAVNNNMLLMSPSATSKELSSASDKRDGGTVGLVWRTAPSDELQVRVIADLLKGTSPIGADAGFAGANKVGILYIDDTYGQGLSQVLAERLTSKTLNSVSYPSAAPLSVLDARLGNLNSFDPDLTVLIGFPADAQAILNRSVNFTNLVKPGHSWFFTDPVRTSALLDLDAGVKTQIDRALGTAPAQNGGSVFTIFAGRYLSETGVSATANSFTAHSYDAMYCVALGAAYAVGTGEVTGERIAQGLTKLSAPSPPANTYRFQSVDFSEAAGKLQAGTAINVSGASGELEFDSTTGEAPSQFEVWQVRGSSIVTVGNVDPPP